MLAVNIYADTQHIDKRGIAYQPDHSGFYKDPYNIRGKFDVRRDLHIVDKDLYALGVMGRAKGSEITQCITYGIGIRETGRYELALRLFEPTVNKHAKRVSNMQQKFYSLTASNYLDSLLNHDFLKTSSSCSILNCMSYWYLRNWTYFPWWGKVNRWICSSTFGFRRIYLAGESSTSKVTHPNHFLAFWNCRFVLENVVFVLGIRTKSEMLF